jgi:dolichyl-phosphate-mannose--protein O-mannosyl transferase
MPHVFNSLDILIKFKLNLKDKKLYDNAAIPTTTLEAAILTNSNFYRRIMRLKYDHSSLSKIITHYSFNDLDFSAVIADFLINSLNNRDPIVDLPLFFKVDIFLCSIFAIF